MIKLYYYNAEWYLFLDSTHNNIQTTSQTTNNFANNYNNIQHTQHTTYTTYNNIQTTSQTTSQTTYNNIEQHTTTYNMQTTSQKQRKQLQTSSLWERWDLDRSENTGIWEQFLNPKWESSPILWRWDRNLGNTWCRRRLIGDDLLSIFENTWWTDLLKVQADSAMWDCWYQVRSRNNWVRRLLPANDGEGWWLLWHGPDTLGAILIITRWGARAGWDVS